ncbi:hypothetical protein [Mycobacterium paragordonae]|uniref:Uncharacterized protein n=1 Tax=Mycobacterium paragordonae TaxID=1389713 RepID=A0A4R5WBH5_9MYCO|nr:hypothetical protein [Mycobacterium paragordonae]MDP7734478.1 hypothetical protein [Mycobacterium paragordonae]TDK86857.1 hypothetical protein EUA02_28105 [Mycobacterium paragordonae]
MVFVFRERLGARLSAVFTDAENRAVGRLRISPNSPRMTVIPLGACPQAPTAAPTERGGLRR